MQTIRIALAARSRAGFPQGVSINVSIPFRTPSYIYKRRHSPKPRRNVITGGDLFRFHESTGLSKISLPTQEHRPKKLRGASACALLRHPECYRTRLGMSTTFSKRILTFAVHSAEPQNRYPRPNTAFTFLNAFLRNDHNPSRIQYLHAFPKGSAAPT